MVHLVTIKELRPKLPKVIENIDRKYDRYVVTKRGEPMAVMISVEDYESLMETLDILSDKKTVKRIKRSERELKEGKTRTWEAIRKDLERV